MGNYSLLILTVIEQKMMLESFFPKCICLLPKNYHKINIYASCACYTNKSFGLTTDYTQHDKKL